MPIAGKLLLVVILIGLLGIGVALVEELVDQRERRFQDVVRAVGATWGAPQSLTGPILAVPYGHPGLRPGAEHAEQIGTLFLLPESLEVNGQIDPQVRRRGIFESVVYRTRLAVDARFRLPEADAIASRDGAPILLWERAWLAVGVPDMRSIRQVVDVGIDGQARSFVPGTGMPDLLSTGMSVALDGLGADLAAQATLDVDFELALNGSHGLDFAPLGRESVVSLASSWPAPSFQGAFLPDEREVGDDGFTAKWTLSHFGRAYPQQLDSAALDADILSQVAASSFGVRLYQPVTTYRKVQRAIKYGLLFLVFTFGFYFLVEVVSERRIHAVQYALVGVPLCLFYLLLVAFAEHVGFEAAYLAGAGCVIALIGAYSSRVLGSRQRGLFVASLLAGLYAYLYSLLQLESYSLLGGALGLLVLNAVFMYATRNVDWYAQKRKSDTGPDLEVPSHA